MRGFKSPGRAQRFLSIFGVIVSFFRGGRHVLAAKKLPRDHAPTLDTMA